MLLFDIIRDWFVLNIFGGVASDGSEVGAFIGNVNLVNVDNGMEDFGSMYSNSPFFKIFSGHFLDWFTGAVSGSDNVNMFISLGDWLSTTSTIIILVMLCAFLVMCTIWLFKFFGGLFKW